LQISSTQPLALWSDDANGVILEAKWRHGFPPQRDLPCEEALVNLSLAQKAFETYHETSLTPRQLLEQRDDLEAALFQLYDYSLNRGHDDDFPLQISILIRQSYEAALAKHGKVGG
jgi:hypothetical protein